MGVFRLIVVVLALLVQAAAVRAEVTVRAAVDQQEVFVGETFTLQIQVEGNDEPGEPDISPLTDFTVESRGGQRNSSESMSIVNGRMSRVSHYGYVFNFALTPRKEGRLVIPALTVTVEQQAYQTQPIPIQVKKPIETDEFKLRMSLDKTKAYVGEPVTLTVVWYIGKDVNSFTFNLPILSDPRFAISEGSVAITNPAQGDLVRFPAPGGEILAEKSTGVLDGVNYLTVSFSRMLTPKEAGLLTLPQATVSCQTLSGGYGRGGRDSLSPDDIFMRSRQYYRTVVVPSNEPALEVLPLPEEGRPSDFSGLVGSYSLAVNATPTRVKVGDPITLTIQVAGPAVAGVAFPSLQNELGANDFKVPAEMAPGEGTSVLKTFTQTVRARHAGVKEIPSLHLTYFDPASGSYRTASSQPVPLEVAEARAVTAQDAEGGEPTAGGSARKDVTTVKGGINFNYEGSEVLTRQTPIGMVGLTPVWYTVLFAPPAFFLLALIATLIARHGRKDPEGRVARQAYRKLAATLDGIRVHSDAAAGYQALGLAMREYLGAKLRRNPAALTYVDVEPQLVKAGTSVETLTGLRQLMDQCEAYAYAGPSCGAGDLASLVDQARQAAAELEKVV